MSLSTPVNVASAKKKKRGLFKNYFNFFSFGMFCISARSVVNAVPGFWRAVDGFNPASANREGEDLGFFGPSISPGDFISLVFEG